MLCAAMLCTSCADSGVSDEFIPSQQEHILRKTLSVSTNSLNFDVNGSSKNLSVTAENVEWELGNLATWLSATPLSGKSSASIVFTAERNNTIGEARSHITTIASKDQSLGYNFPITLTQEAQQAYIKPAITSVTFTASSQTKTIDVTSNVKWTCKSTASWLSVAGYSSYIRISVTENNASANERKEIISLQDSETGKEYATITVVQNAFSKIYVPDILTFSADGGVEQFNITSDVSYSIVSSNTSWLTTSPTYSSNGTRTITVSATRNNEYSERTGAIYIRVNGNNAATVNVTQAAASLPSNQQITEVNKSSDTFTSTGGSLSLSFNTNGAWTITKPSAASWLTLSSTSGTGDARITVWASDNPSVSSRTATLTIKPVNGKAVETSFTQSGRYLTLSSTSDVVMFAKGGTANPIYVTTDGSWSVTSSSTSWLTVSKSATSFTITAKENSTGSARSGIVTVELTGLTDANRYFKTINVTQLVQGELYLNGKTSGTSDSGTSFSINLTNYGNDEDWNGQITSK